MDSKNPGDEAVAAFLRAAMEEGESVYLVLFSNAHTGRARILSNGSRDYVLWLLDNAKVAVEEHGAD